MSDRYESLYEQKDQIHEYNFFFGKERSKLYVKFLIDYISLRIIKRYVTF